MSNEISKTERQLKSSDGETPDLRGVIGQRDPEDVDLFGFQIIYTTGEFTVPRDALLNKMNEVGLPEWMAPGVVKPHRAFGRMVSEIEEELDSKDEIQGLRINFDFDSGDSRYEKHVHAKVWHSADDDDVNATAGKWVDHELGVVVYDSDSKGLHFVDRVDEGHALASLWFDGIKSRAEQLFEKHQELHNGKDVNNMTYYLCRNWTDSVKLRDSCYFVPAAYEDIESLIDGFRELYQWIDSEFKTRGQETELFAIEIVDSERQRDMVERKVRRELEDEVVDVYDDIVSEIRDGAAADAIAEQVVSDISEIKNLADRHSSVLKTELSVKRAMAEVLEDLDADQTEVVDRALAEAGLAPENEELEAAA